MFCLHFDSFLRYWFRKALRLHDNVPLLQASKSEIPLLPIFILDPLFLPETRDENTVENATGALAGNNQFQFLMEVNIFFFGKKKS